MGYSIETFGNDSVGTNHLFSKQVELFGSKFVGVQYIAQCVVAPYDRDSLKTDTSLTLPTDDELTKYGISLGRPEGLLPEPTNRVSCNTLSELTTSGAEIIVANLQRTGNGLVHFGILEVAETDIQPLTYDEKSALEGIIGIVIERSRSVEAGSDESDIAPNTGMYL